MISDKEFKKLRHTYKNYECFNNGGEVEKGYKPDYVLHKDGDYIILESENSSSRKTFVGGMLKAAHFLRDKKSGILVFVMTPKRNTNIESITTQIETYFKWVKGQIKTGLNRIYVIEVGDYWNRKEEKLLSIDSPEFKEKSKLIKS